MPLGFKCHQFVRNDEVWRLTRQPKLTAIVQSRRLTLFGHIARMDDNRCQEDPVNSPSKQTSRTPPNHMAEHHTAGSEIPWSHTVSSNGYGSEPVSVEDVVSILVTLNILF